MVTMMQAGVTRRANVSDGNDFMALLRLLTALAMRRRICARCLLKALAVPCETAQLVRTARSNARACSRGSSEGFRADLLFLDDDGSELPCGHARGQLDRLLSMAAVGRAVRRGRVLIVGPARDWSLTVRADVGAVWLCIEDDDQLERVIAGTQAIRRSELDGAGR
ncbi:MAG: hypothetical protein Q8O67_31600 [Deltaproteobacteria bacterium]|nr:hypothetical protein [Deltaproteobacteria bacterium]